MPVDSMTTSTPSSAQRSFAGSPSCRHRHALAVYREVIRVRDHVVGVAPQDGVVLEQMPERRGVSDVIDRDDPDVGVSVGGPKHLPSDTSEPVDSNCDRHSHLLLHDTLPCQHRSRRPASPVPNVPRSTNPKPTSAHRRRPATGAIRFRRPAISASCWSRDDQFWGGRQGLQVLTLEDLGHGLIGEHRADG
jgi:hypothetical protein